MAMSPASVMTMDMTKASRGRSMKTAEIFETSQGQTVRLPDEFRFDTHIVSIRRQGEAVVLEPVKPATWPEHFFDQIRIDDPTFVRPPQGEIPPVPSFD